jgi:hypothetical protein
MANKLFKLSIVCSVFLFFACNTDNVNVNELNTTQDSLTINEPVLVEPEIIEDTITCKETKKKNEDNDFPILIKTCFYGDYQTIAEGYPDNNERYHYSYQLFKKINNKFTSIKNNELFNDNKNELLAIINKKVQKEYNDLLKDPENEDCMANVSKPKVTFDNLNIEFSSNEINFIFSFGIDNSMCMAVDEVYVNFNLNDIKKYIR